MRITSIKSNLIGKDTTETIMHSENKMLKLYTIGNTGNAQRVAYFIEQRGIHTESNEPAKACRLVINEEAKQSKDHSRKIAKLIQELILKALDENYLESESKTLARADFENTMTKELSN